MFGRGRVLDGLDGELSEHPVVCSRIGRHSVRNERQLGVHVVHGAPSFSIRLLFLSSNQSPLFNRAELPRGHLPDVQRLRLRRQHCLSLGRRRRLSPLHDADVRPDGRQLGLHAHRMRQFGPCSESVFIL